LVCTRAVIQIEAACFMNLKLAFFPSLNGNRDLPAPRIFGRI